MAYENHKTLMAMIEAQAGNPDIADRTLVVDGESRWSYREYRDHCVQMAGFLFRRACPAAHFTRGHVAVMMENRKEYLALLGGCAYAGLTFFAINPLLRGEALAQTLNKSRATLLVIGEEFAEAVRAVLPHLEHVDEAGLFILGDGPTIAPEQNLLKVVAGEPTAPEQLASIDVRPEDTLLVIYTSGTTGVPKGVLVSQARLCRSAAITGSAIALSKDDVSYLCMPMCHSNGLMGNFMPMLSVGGRVAIRRRFSVSRFIDDILDHGITYWTYVGEPIHYILNHVEARFGADEERIRWELTDNPRNKLRFALGNGASAVDQERFIRWFGLDHMYEAYGQSEAVIMAFRMPDTPRGSVGEIHDAEVRILAEDGSECPPAEFDDNGNLVNYGAAMGQLCRIHTDSELFLGYFDNPAATANKCRDGIYYSGDLAHIAIISGRRWLYFDGRTDDWIRKDGENFSAEPIGHTLSEHPDIQRAVVYGVPNVVASDLVMVALAPREGHQFDAAEFFRWCRQRQREGALEEKWLPDFVRVVPDFEHTASNKIQLHVLKRGHFDPAALPGSTVYWRTRGEHSFRPLTASDYALLRELYAAQERLHLLDR